MKYDENKFPTIFALPYFHILKEEIINSLIFVYLCDTESSFRSVYIDNMKGHKAIPK